jgi:hypothetical protein
LTHFGAGPIPDQPDPARDRRRRLNERLRAEWIAGAMNFDPTDVAPA